MVSFPGQSNAASYALGTGAVSGAVKVWSSNNRDGFKTSKNVDNKKLWQFLTKRGE